MAKMGIFVKNINFCYGEKFNLHDTRGAFDSAARLLYNVHKYSVLRIPHTR